MSTAALLIRHRARQTPQKRWAEVLEDVVPFLGMSDEEHDALLQQVVSAAHQLLLDQPRQLESEPPAPDFAEAWKRLHARHS